MVSARKGWAVKEHTVSGIRRANILGVISPKISTSIVMIRVETHAYPSPQRSTTSTVAMEVPTTLARLLPNRMAAKVSSKCSATYRAVRCFFLPDSSARVRNRRGVIWV